MCVCVYTDERKMFFIQMDTTKTTAYTLSVNYNYYLRSLSNLSKKLEWVKKNSKNVSATLDGISTNFQ